MVIWNKNNMQAIWGKSLILADRTARFTIIEVVTTHFRDEAAGDEIGSQWYIRYELVGIPYYVIRRACVPALWFRLDL